MGISSRVKAAYDRGWADSYYYRGRTPNIRECDIGVKDPNSKSGKIYDLTQEEKTAYYKGYDENEELGDKKQWE